jgi:hypothetical protein
MSDFIDHGTDVTDGLKVVIRKDEWVASRPWFADRVFADGTVWKDWQSFFRSKKRLIENARAAAPRAEIVDA